MPLYEYVCQSCGQSSEVLIRGSEQPECPECGSAKLDRQLSVPAAHTATRQLPMTDSPCGRPQCAGGGCMNL